MHQTQQQTVLIGGGSGFVGRFLKRHLEHHGFKVLVLSRSAQRGDITWQQIKEQGLPKCNTVINLAGKHILDLRRRWMGYGLWLAVIINGMRAQRRRFEAVIFFFSLFTLIALFVLIVGIATPYIDYKYFYLAYTQGIAISFFLIVAALIIFPELLNELAEVVKMSYASSTLTDVDVEEMIQKFENMMNFEKMYQNENLNLAMVAEELKLSPHQLSELVNVKFGINFSRYIREHRVTAAKKLLVNEPEASVLAIGLETGFKSQSNFYVAFKEITSMSPGSYRKSILKNEE